MIAAGVYLNKRTYQVEWYGGEPVRLVVAYDWGQNGENRVFGWALSEYFRAATVDQCADVLRQLTTKQPPHQETP